MSHYTVRYLKCRRLHNATLSIPQRTRRRNEDRQPRGSTTALHKALDKTLEMLVLDTELIEERHGGGTPETMADKFRSELDALIGVSFRRELADEFERQLREQVKECEEVEQ